MLRTCRTVLLPLTLVMALGACAGPIDRPLDTSHGDAAYFERLNALFEKMSPDQQNAFNWAVSDLDIAALNQRYPNGSPRQIILGEIQQVLSTYPERIAALQPELEAYKAMQAQVSRLTASDVQFRIDRNFHGLQPKISFTVHNGSELALSTSGWLAQLYIDERPEPVAGYVMHLDHTDRNGLRPGNSQRHTRTLGFVTGDADWITLEIRNASVRRVTLQPQQSGLTDLGNRSLSTRDPSAEMARLEETIATAKRWQATLD